MRVITVKQLQRLGVKVEKPPQKPKRPHVPGRMNALEQRYAYRLETRRQQGEIKSFQFEPRKLTLAPRTTYTPDFRVVMPDGSMEFHEVKGFWRDDARVKIKVAAAKFKQYTFRTVKWDSKKRDWKVQEVRKK